MTKHTPGPWTIEDDNRRTIERGTRLECAEIWKDEGEQGQRLIATVHYHGGDFDEDAEPDANTRLIAAAPDLLEACEKVIARQYQLTPNPHYEHIDRIRAAIEKATGTEDEIVGD